ncbi:MMPL family transporter [Desulfuromonas carbonis]|uniref:MMPL family transporter n=1 Tax=Desulfuromonas sp. DDH964 TaxID=1823759 RepID=UPI00078B8716|nr:MMPL family transporter [Desulfuromonas sp. DDH964]AMV72124.1 exporter [Desulfuromonas sp. DDH964]
MPGIGLFFAAAYRWLAPRRRWLFAVTLLVLVASAWAASSLRLEENIATMLPDGNSGVAEDFQLLQEAPFARKLVISVRADTGSDPARLPAVVDSLAAALDPGLFIHLASGPDQRLQTRLMPWLIDSLPNLASADDLAAMAKRLEGGGAGEALRRSYEQLLGPEGWALKNMIRRDPLDLRRIGLEKLRYLNLVPGVRLVDNHFVSADGRSALLLAETPIAITDSAGAAALEQGFEQARRQLPAGYSALLVSAHRYTLANARVIQQDLWWILGCSGVALLLIFVLLLRSLRAVYVFLIPVAVLAFAGLAVAVRYPTVSAITLGFGAVLMGITVDFGLHVYYALRYGQGSSADLIGRVARPVLFGGLTTIAAFAVLLGSDLPGQRQLALFSIAGLTAALLLALLVLPHLVPVGSQPMALPRPVSSRPSARRRRLLVLMVWALFCSWCAWQAPKVEINGDLRRMSLVPPELAAAEKRLAAEWGGFRDQAMIWTRAGAPDTALSSAAAVAQSLTAAELPMVSLAPLVPPAGVQAQNRERWQAFWTGPRGVEILAALEREAAALGFAAGAFEPFRQSLVAPAPQITLAGAREAGLGSLVDALVVPSGEGIRILTLTPDSPRVAALVAGLGPALRLVSPARFREEIGSAISSDFLRFISGAGLLAGALLILLFRRVGKVLTAALPVVTGLLGMFGIMGFWGIEFNLFNIVATILVIGLGMDYGIFMVCRYSEGQDMATGRAILASGLTTLAGFGALVLGRHPALHSIGVTVLLGIGCAIPAALLVIPALYGRRQVGR